MQPAPEPPSDPEPSTQPLQAQAGAGAGASGPSPSPQPGQASVGEASPACSPPEAQRQPAGGSWGGWGFGSIASKLEAAAAGAARDLRDLSASVNQIVAEVVAADEPGSDLERLSEYQPARAAGSGGEGGGSSGGAAAPPPAVTASRGDSRAALAEAAGTTEGPQAGDDEAARRRAVLARLEGDDTQLESGLKAIDEQVDALAASAAKALSGLWGGLGSVAKRAGAVGAAISSKVVGRNAAQLLEPLAGGARRSSGGGPGRDWTTSLDSCVELFGGGASLEQLELLSAECSSVCTKARAALPEDARQIDAALAELAPLFAAEGLVGEAAAGEPQRCEGLESLLLPLAAIKRRGLAKAAQLPSDAAQAGAQAAAEADEQQGGDARGQAGGRSSADGGEPGSEAAGASSQAADADVAAARQAALLATQVASWRGACVKSLGELCAGQVELLLTLARSLAAVPRYGKPLDDGLEWPGSSQEAARLVRREVACMLADLQELAAAYQGALPLVLRALRAAPDHEGAQQQAAQAAAQVEADCASASRRVSDGLGKLLPVVLLAALHQAGSRAGGDPTPGDGGAAPAAPEPAPPAAAEAGGERREAASEP